MSYNGRTNRETWLVNVWFNPESKEDVARAKAYLEDQYDMLPDFFRDMVDMSVIDWEELESQFEDEEEEEEA